MYYLLLVPLFIALYFGHEWWSNPYESDEALMEELRQSDIVQKKVFGAMEKSVTRIEHEEHTPAIAQDPATVLSGLDLSNPTQKKLADYLTAAWASDAKVDSQSLAILFEEELKAHPQETFNSLKFAILQLPVDGLNDEKSGLFEVLKEVDFEGSSEEIKRLALMQIKINSAQKDPPEELIKEAFFVYLERGQNQEEAVFEAQALTQAIEASAFRAEIFSAVKSKYPSAAIENSDRLPADE